MCAEADVLAVLGSLTLPSCGQGSMGEALLLEAVCISSSDMTGAASLEPADKLPPFSPPSSLYLALDVSKLYFFSHVH